MSIHKRRNGKGTSYMVSWRDGSKQRTRTFPTMRQARAWQAEVDQAKARGATGPALPTKLTLDEWLERWITERAPEWAKTTARQRGYMLDRWVSPLIGHKGIAQLDKPTLRSWRHEVAESSSANNANAAMRVLSAALGAAVDDEIIPVNPCHGIRSLPVKRQRPQALTPDVVERIRDAMPTNRDRLIVSIMAYCGLRPAEVCGLTWRHVGDGLLLVEQSVQIGEVVSTKTGAARTVEVTPPVQEELAAMRGEPEAFVAPGDRGGPLSWRNWNARVWRPVVRELGYACVPYDCRHTAASLWLHEGRSLAWVSRALGHANQMTTLANYSHAYEEARLATAVPMHEAILAARGLRNDQLVLEELSEVPLAA
jgi:integrase